MAVVVPSSWLLVSFMCVIGVVVAFECQTDTNLGPAVMPGKKGIAVDDYTLRWCSSRIPSAWPNAQSEMTSIRLFKAWDPSWDEAGRVSAWRNLKAYATSVGGKVLVGTPVSCSEENDDKFWAWTKELMDLLGPDHILGLAIGNELELLQFKGDISSVTPECVTRIWDGGYYWRLFTRITADMDRMGAAFKSIPVTGVFTGMALGGEPFYEVPGKALVHSFLKNATIKYGQRFVFTFNFYPYFDPNQNVDEGTDDQCSAALSHTSCWGSSCNVPATTRHARQKMQKLTGNSHDSLWIGETGWSWPLSGSLTTRMKPCIAWSAETTFRTFYKGFLAWDLSLGPDSKPPDHVFWFTMRDSVNFGLGEHFGLIASCDEPKCKVHSEDYVAARYQRHSTGTQSFCSDALLTESFIENGDTDKVCRDRCTLDTRCRYYSIWASGWCRLTSSCLSTAQDGDHMILVFVKQTSESSTGPSPTPQGGETVGPSLTPRPVPQPTATPTRGPTQSTPVHQSEQQTTTVSSVTTTDSAASIELIQIELSAAPSRGSNGLGRWLLTALVGFALVSLSAHC